MAKFSDAIQDTLGRVLEGYISAHGGDPTTTPTYQDRERRQELEIEQEKSRLRKEELKEQEASRFRLFKKQKRFEKKTAGTEVDEDAQKIRNMIGSYEKNIRESGIQGLNVTPQRLQEEISAIAKGMASEVGEKARTVDPNLYNQSVRPEVTRLINASREVATNSYMTDDGRREAWQEIGDQLAKYDQDMIPQLTTQQKSDKVNEDFFINMVPLSGGAYGFFDSNGQPKINHNNAEVFASQKEQEERVIAEARKQEQAKLFAQHMESSMAETADMDALGRIEAKFGKGALDAASSEQREELISMEKKSYAINRWKARDELFNVDDLVSWNSLDRSLQSVYEKRARDGMKTQLLMNGGTEMTGLSIDQLKQIPQIAKELYISEREGKRQDYLEAERRVKYETNSRMIEQAKSNPTLRNALIRRMSPSDLNAAALERMDPLDWAQKYGKEFTGTGYSAPESRQVSEPSQEPSGTASALPSEPPKAKPSPQQPVSQEAAAQAKAAQDSISTYKDLGVADLAETSRQLALSSDMMNERSDAIIKMKNAGLSYDQSEKIATNPSPYHVAFYSDMGMDVNDAVKSAVDQAANAAVYNASAPEEKKRVHISTLSPERIDNLFNGSGAFFLTGNEEEDEKIIAQKSIENPGQPYFTADGYLSSAGKMEGGSYEEEMRTTVQAMTSDPEEFAKRDVRDRPVLPGKRSEEEQKQIAENISKDIADLPRKLADGLEYAKDQRYIVQAVSEGIPDLTDGRQIASYLNLAALTAMNFGGGNSPRFQQALQDAKKKFASYKGRPVKQSKEMVDREIVDQFNKAKEEVIRLKSQPSTPETSAKILEIVTRMKMMQDVMAYRMGNPEGAGSR